MAFLNKEWQLGVRNQCYYSGVHLYFFNFHNFLRLRSGFYDLPECFTCNHTFFTEQPQ